MGMDDTLLVVDRDGVAGNGRRHIIGSWRCWMADSACRNRIQLSAVKTKKTRCMCSVCG